MALFLDLTPLNESATNAALDFIYKSSHDHNAGIWSPHESVLVRRIIESFTQRGLDRLKAVQDGILAWQNGDNYTHSTAPVAHPGMMARWNAAEQELVKLYLESIPVDQWTIDDHMMSVDYVVQKYLPATELVAEAEWMSVRSSMMGKVQANLADANSLTMKQVDLILAGMPSTVAQAIETHTLKKQQAAALRFSAARSAEHVVALSDSVRHQMKSVILQHAEQKAMQVEGVAGQSLQTVLFDKFAELNRDWRRVAVTEAGEAQLQGYIASLPYGSKVKRVEQYATACNFCKKIDGFIAEVVDPAAPDKDGATQVWVGKSNYGRSASPRKRVDGKLVPREELELYWLPAGTAHPHCRGRWVLVSNPDDAQEGDDPEFAAELLEILK